MRLWFAEKNNFLNTEDVLKIVKDVKFLRLRSKRREKKWENV